MVWIPQTSVHRAKTPTPGYVLDVGTVSDPSTADILTVSSANPINIPISYGRRAIFGVLIWSGNFKVVGSSTGDFATYCDFAVAFGYPGTPTDELQEVKISRIWIEQGTSLGPGGRLIFDRTTPGGYALSADLDITIYDGSEEQVADERIVAVEGVENAVPFRGLVYVMFRKFNLAKYGLTAIPQFRAELVDITEPTNYFLPFDEDGIYAKATLTFTTNPTNGKTVTLDGQVYTFVAGDANAAYKVHIGDNISGTIQNFVHAVNANGSPGNDTYGAGTVVHPTVKATAGTSAPRTVVASARTSGTSGNAINVSETINGSWSGTHLSGALSDNIPLPDTMPVAMDWQRNRAYMISETGGHKVLRVYDLTSMREITRGTIRNENGAIIPAGSLNDGYFLQVDEATGTIYTTFGGTTNNVPMLSINPNTFRVTSRIGHASTGFPAVVPGIPTISFPYAMRFGTTTLGYGMCSGTRRYAIVSTLFNEIFVVGINTDGTLVGPIGGNTSYANDINDIAVQNNVLSSKAPGTTVTPGTFTIDPRSANDIVGIRAYVAAGNKLYNTVWSTMFPNLEHPGTETLVTLPSGYNIKKVIYNEQRGEVLLFYHTNLAVCHVRRYTWEPTISSTPYFAGIPLVGTFTMQYDKVVPDIALGAFQIGSQYSRWEVGEFGYESSISGDAVAVVINTQDGRYRTYPLEVYVEYNVDFLTNETATTNTFNYLTSFGNNPFCAAGGYFVGRPTIGGGTITAGLMYVDGILNFRVELRSLLRWLALSAGYTDDQISIDVGIDDKILGSVIDERTDIFSLIEALGIVFNFKYFESEEIIKFVRPPSGESMTISAELTIDNIGPIGGGDRVIDQESFIIDMAPDSDTPDTVALTFLDFTNDYQASTVTARKSRFPFQTKPSNNEASYSIPIIMTPSEAVQRIYKSLYLLEIQRVKAQFRTGFEFLRVEPVDAISINVNDVSYTMSVYETTTNDDYSITIGAYSLATEDVDIQTIEDDLTPTQVIVGSYLTETIIIDAALITPADEPTDSGSLVVYLAAYGYNSSWPGATIYYGLGGGSFNPVLNVISTETIGHVTSDLIDTGMEYITDESAAIDVQLINPVAGFVLPSATDDELLDKANYALIGVTGSWEIIQWRDVTDNGNGSFTLSGIIRGIRNTDHNMGAHTAGCYFIPVASSFVPQIHVLNENDIGQEAFYTARNTSQETILNVPQSFVINSTSRKPWSPSDYRVSFDIDHFVLAWARRTKDDAPLEDGTGTVSLEFTSERFEVDIYNEFSNEVVATLSATGAETVDYTDTTFFADAFPHTTYSQTILNPGAQATPSPTAHWTTTSGTLNYTNTIGHNSTHAFLNLIAPVLSHQDISVSAFSTPVDAGDCKVLVSWWQDGSTNPDGTGAVDVAFYDGSPGSLISTHTGTQLHTDTGGDNSFTFREMIVDVPVNTRTVRLIMNMPSSASTYIDDISLDMWVLDTTPVHMTFAVYQLSDDALIGRGEGRIRAVDIQY